MPLKGFKFTEESIQKLSKSHKGQIPWNKGRPFSEESKKRMSEAQKKRAPASDETRKKLSKANTGHVVSDATRKKIAESHIGIKASEDARQKMSEIRRGLKLSEAHKKSISESESGDKHWNWQGGISAKPYCPKFNKSLKEEIREAFGRRCFLCGAPETKKKLHVHHCDYNKGQGCGQKWNLVPLCNRCHSKTGVHRHYYFNFLANYWAAEYLDGIGCWAMKKY